MRHEVGFPILFCFAIFFSCIFSTANNFLKMLSAETGGRYHSIHTDFDAQLYAHKLLTEGFHDPEVNKYKLINSQSTTD